MSLQGELQDTTFLAERLSIALGIKFSAKQEERQDSDTDTYIISPSSEKTPVQNVTSEGEVTKNSKLNRDALSKDLPLIAGQVKHLDWVSDAISRKESKRYSDARSLVLVIHGSMPTISAWQVEEMFKDIECAFAGIYYVSLPNSSAESGYIVAVKKYWDTENIF